MISKNKRFLWLLNHRTLMPYEAPLIRRLGFEIFIPKVIPKTNFRSAAVDFSHDESLTIPPGVLEKLNQFNFYEDAWTPEIVTLVNRYFGTVFIIPHARQTLEAVQNFEGQIVFRAFGLDNEQSYKKVLENLHGPLLLRMIEGIKHRFWFGEGYDHLHECEDPLFEERSLYLPIGVPDSFFADANKWTGKDRKILFVCPFVGSNPYYTEIYERFKNNFGDLPHVIVGAQDVPVSDPHVAGFVSDDELKRLYLECAVLYYPSTELRHVHYSPIEAAINGMPIVFFENSLLSRMSRGATKGRVSSIAEARQIIERILVDDAALIAEIREDQREIAYHFSDAYCSETWRTQMHSRGFIQTLSGSSIVSTLLKEATRSALKPLAHGRTRIDPHRRAIQPFKATLDAAQARQAFGSSLYEGIDFSRAVFPAMVDYVSGVSAGEGWGRWSNGDKVSIVLKHLLQGKVRIFIRAIAYGDNAGVPLPMKVGGQTKTFQLSAREDEASGTWLHFELKKPSNVIEIEIPHPTRPSLDGRALGIGLIELRAADPVTLSAEQARKTLGASLVEGIDFSAPELPAFVDVVEGLGGVEPWGRWSVGEQVRFELNHTLEGPVRLLLRGVGFGPNVGAGAAVTVGHQVRFMPLPASLADGEELAVDFDLSVPSNVIEFKVPHPSQPEGDDRRIGIGFFGLRSAQIPAAIAKVSA
ncbi:DUF7024 domain-containing protein [Variovorax guangxiensis]|uniref:DUF7024 domain-containing protein n=1 Tax=Variovorax guangxiensis TaxID=1775474 RepID=UPI002864E5AD|nr:hypothetical protein [Variovorax guangxiensis]MDR6857585.1 hypothetical protein [Variovorax guangxiensis]